MRDLQVSYLSGGRATSVIDGLRLGLRRGEALGLVGESGCGKSTLALAVAGLLPRGRAKTAGEAILAGHGDILSLPESKLRRLRGNRMAMIFQDPMTSLNPYMRIGDQLAEPLRLHRGLSKREAREQVTHLMGAVGIADPATRLRQYPHEFSGGMRQRAMIAMAMSCDPDLLIADEPTTALDVTTQKMVLQILRQHQQERHMGMLLITHDLGVVADTCDRVAVMYAGQVVELGAVDQVLAAPRHPYTQALLRAIPSARRPRVLRALPGMPPTDRLAAGCRLAPRCPFVQDRCRESATPLHQVAPGHEHRCLREDAAHMGPPELLPDELPAAEPPEPIMRVEDLVVTYPGRQGLLRREPDVQAVRGVSLEVRPGEILGIAGESGSGKSTLIRAMLRLIPSSGGRLHHASMDGPRRASWRAMQLIFQDPASSLDPRLTVSRIIREPLDRYRVGDMAWRRERVRQLMDQVGIPAAWQDRYPHELSGGQQQRIGIARALALDPEILFCDEPVSALDVSIQAQILNLLKQLQSERQMAMVFVSHDLSVIRYLCDRVIIMQRGEIVESGDTKALYETPQATYTQVLLGAIPGSKGVLEDA